MNIVAIGGGERTPAIRHALELTGDNKPHALIVPSACSTEHSFQTKAKNVGEYFLSLGVTSELLHNYNEKPTLTKIAHEIGKASLLYTIGGNSPHMLATLRAHETDQAIKQAVLQGKVHAGTSAGALLPFELAHSCVAKKPAAEEWDYEYLHPLGIIPGVATAHANQHDPTPQGQRVHSRLDALMATFPSAASVGYAIDNEVAAVFSSDEPRIIRAQSNADIHIITRSVNGTNELKIAEEEDLKL